MLLTVATFMRAAEDISLFERRIAAVAHKTLHEFITVDAAVELLVRTYGQYAQSEASRRAHYAWIARRRSNYQFWEEVLQKLAGNQKRSNTQGIPTLENKAEPATG